MSLQTQMQSELSAARLSKQLDRIQFGIEQANTEPIELDERTGEQILEEMDEDLAASLFADVVAEAISKTLEETPAKLPSMEQNPLQWTKNMLTGMNAWELFDEVFSRFQRIPGGGLALRELIGDAARTSMSEAAKMAKRMADGCNQALDEYEANPKAGRKPAELYRIFYPAFELAWRTYGLHVGATMSRLVLAQSLPQTELDNPDWVDPYTGEIDPEAERPQAIRARITVFQTPETERLKADLGWDDKQVEAFLAAQEDFNAEEFEEEVFFDEYDVKETVTEEIQEDLKPKNIGELQRESEDLRKALRTRIDDAYASARIDAAMRLGEEVRAAPMFAKLNSEIFTAACLAAIEFPKIVSDQVSRDVARSIYKMVPEEVERLRSWKFEKARQEVRDSDEAWAFERFLQKKANDGEHPVDLSRLFLAFQHGLGFTEEDAEQIKLEGQYPTLFDYIEEYGEEITEGMLESGLGSDKAPVSVEKYYDETLDMLAKQGVENGSDICNTPVFLRAFYQAMFTAKDLRVQDENGLRNVALEAGWEAWRKEKSAAGNIAYHRRLAECLAEQKTNPEKYEKASPQKVAMQSFWAIANQKPKQKSKDKIRGVASTGLILESGRSITWRIAAMKLKADEFELSDEKREKLIALLRQHGQEA